MTSTVQYINTILPSALRIRRSLYVFLLGIFFFVKLNLKQIKNSHCTRKKEKKVFFPHIGVANTPKQTKYCLLVCFFARKCFFLSNTLKTGQIKTNQFKNMHSAHKKGGKKISLPSEMQICQNKRNIVCLYVFSLEKFFFSVKTGQIKTNQSKNLHSAHKKNISSSRRCELRTSRSNTR